MTRTTNNFLITLLMWLFWLIHLSGGLNTDGVQQSKDSSHIRHTRAAMPWRSMEASRKDNKRYSRITSVDKTFDKIFLNKFKGSVRDKRAVGADGNQTINLSMHNISDINLSEFLKEITSPSQVAGLNLSMNHLRQLNKSAFVLLPHLSALDVSQNQLSTIDDAVELTKLTTLNVSHNNLYKFATTISDAAATILPIAANNHNNTSASISPDTRTSVSSSSIQLLDLSCNKFNSSRNIVLYNLNNLQLLDLSCNELTTIDRNLFFNLTQLHNLDLSYNQVSELLANTFVYLTQLQVLNLSNNNISFIQNDTFITMPNLEYLDVSNNFIRADSIHALQGIPDLVALSIANNEQLSESLQGFVATWSLKELDGSGTGLCHIPAALTQSVRILKLVDNYLEVIRCGDLDSYPLLQHLILSSNRISDIEDDALGRLEIIETLYLNDNQLKRIPVSLPSSLIDLHLENNLITEIQPQVLMGLKTLALLNLSGNKIIYLPGLPLPRLSRLNMRACELESVNQELVKMSPYLRDLYLEVNPIRCADLLGIAEWATPCRDSSGETAESIVVSAANDYFLHKWHTHPNHSCKSGGKMASKQKFDNKVCKEVIREAMPKNNKTVPTTSATVTVEKINDNNYFTGNKGSERGTAEDISVAGRSDGVVVADNKLIERQSSLSRQQSSSENQKQWQKPDKNVNDKFENTDIIRKNDNNVNDDDGTMTTFEQTMTLKRNNNTININETDVGKSTKQTKTSRANITRSFDKLPYNNNNNIKTKTTMMSEQTQKMDTKQEFRKTTTVEDNQIAGKKLIFNSVTSTLGPTISSTTSTNNNIYKNQINERVQTNDVNHPIKLAKQKKVSKNWKSDKQLKQQLPDHVINMSSFNKAATQTPKVTIKVTKSKTRVMAITNDDDYLNDDNKAVVDNFVTVSSRNQNNMTLTTTTENHKKENSLEAKQLSLHFNFTKIHPTNDDKKKASTTQHQLLSSTSTAKPYSDRTKTSSTTQTTHNKINLDKHVQLNRKVNVLQQNSQLVTNNNDNMEEGYQTTTTISQQAQPQQFQHSHNTEPHQTLNPILNNEHNNEVTVASNNEALPPQKQEWSDIRTDVSYSGLSHKPSYLGHPGLFMVIGATIGMAVAFGFVHLYRCQKLRLWQHQQYHRSNVDPVIGGSCCDSISDISTINTPTHHHRCRHQYHDLLPMDVLNNKSHHMTTNSTAAATTSLISTTRTTTATTPNSPIELW